MSLKKNEIKEKMKCRNEATTTEKIVAAINKQFNNDKQLANRWWSHYIFARRLFRQGTIERKENQNRMSDLRNKAKNYLLKCFRCLEVGHLGKRKKIWATEANAA